LNSLAEIQVVFVIVNYNTRDLLQACLSSIIETTTLDYRIVVVDNNSQDGSSEMVQSQFPTVNLIQNPTNVGFPQAVNQGLRAETAPFYFVLNSDIQLLEGTTTTLYHYLLQNPQTGIAAPAQMLPNDELLLSVHAFPNLRREWARNLLFTDVWSYRLRGQKNARKITEPISVDWVMGAALFVRRELIASTGYMDEAIFMYGEELDWCYRAHQTGWLVDFVPSALLIHHKSASADKAFNVYRYQYVVKSNYYFFAQHFGLWQLPLFVLAQVIGSLLRTLISGLLCLLRHHSFCHQAREHIAVLQISFDPKLYKWIRKAITAK
jgi:GT2 family glycosyltransferase